MSGVDVVTVLAIISAVSSVASLAISLSMRPDGMEQTDNGSNISRKGKNDPKLVSFGRCLLPASRVWQNAQNSDTRWLTQVYSFGIGPVLKFEQIYIDAIPVYKDNNSAKEDQWNGQNTTGYQSTEFPNLAWGLRVGKTKETAYNQLIEHSDGEWSESHRGDRTASAGLLVERWLPSGGDNNIRIVSPNIRIEALVHGNAVIDPRFVTDVQGAVNDVTKRIWVSGTKECYRNPAAVMYTYLVDEYYGVGLPIDSIDKASFIALANYCDQVGLYFDGYVDQSQAFDKILLDMATAADAVIYFEDGAIKIKADKLAAVTSSITPENIVGGFTLSNSNSGDYYNTVKVEFVNGTTVYTKDQYMIPKDKNASAKINADGYVKEKVYKLPYTVDYQERDFQTVKRLANKYLRKATLQKSLSFDMDNTTYNLRVMDVIEVSHPDYGLEKSKFRVQKLTSSLDDKALISKVVATEYSDLVYDEAGYKDDGITSPPSIIPSLVVRSPVDLKFNQSGYTKSGSGVLSWNTRYQKEHRNVVEYKRHDQNDTAWTRFETQGDNYQFYGLKAGHYDFRVLTRSYFGNTSDWARLDNQEIKAGVTLPKVTGLTADFSTRDCIVTWDDMSKTALTGIPDLPVYDGVSNVGDVLAYYEIDVYKGAPAKYIETLTSTTNRFVYTYSQNAMNTLSRDLRFDVRIASTDGSKSQVVQATAHNAQVGQPSGITVNGEIANLLVNWDSPIDEDYSQTEIHIGTNANFVPSATTLQGTSKTGFIQIVWPDDGKFWFVKLAHYDLFGKDGMSYSKAIAFEMKGLDELLTKTESWDALGKELDQAQADIIKGRTDIDKQRSEIDQHRKDIDTNKANITKSATEIKTANEVIKVQGAAIETNKEAIASTDGNLAELSTSVDTRFKDANAKITASQTAIANDVKALADYKLVVTSEFGKTNTNVTNLTTTVADDKKALADYKVAVDAEFDKTNANVTTLNTAVAEDKKALADYKLVVKAELDKTNANVTTNATAIATDQKALADYKVTVKSELDKTNANVTTLNTTVADDKKALADYKVSVKSSFDGVNADITQNSTAISGVDGKVKAMHQIKLDVNNKVSGLILANTGTESTFDVIADRFRVANGANAQAVFEINAGKTLIRNALIDNLTSANITAGSIQGVSINSSTLIRAGSGNTSASLDGADGTWRIYAGNTSGGAAPFRVNTAGKLFATGAEISGHIDASSGSFTGAINAQSGAISGYLAVGNGYISGNTGHNFLYNSGGNFRVDHNGNLYANNGVFNGTIRADKIEGDVVKVYSLPNYVVDEGNGYSTINFTIPASARSRTVIINGIQISARGSTQGGGGDHSDKDITSSAYCEITLNGNRTAKSVSATGGGSYEFAIVNHSVDVAANATCTVYIRMGGGYTVSGSICMAFQN